MKKVTSVQFADSVIWKFIDLVFRKIVSLGLAVLLARLLDPEVYAIIALTTVFISFSDIFILNGFSIALIRKENINEQDYSTTFCMSLFTSITLYFAFWILAPYIADFYKILELKNVLRVISISIIFQSLTTIIRAKATRELEFKKIAISTSISNILAGIIGLIAAYKGYGVWSLVLQQVAANFFDMLLMIFLFKWKIILNFSKYICIDVLKFSLGIFGISFLDFCVNNINMLTIGKYYSKSTIGYLNRATVIPETIGLNVYNAIGSAILPTLSLQQNNLEEMKKIVRKVVSFSIYIIFPLMFGLISISDILIPILLTNKWISIIPLMNIICINYAINPIRSIAYNVFYVKKENKLGIMVEVFRFVITVINLIITVVIMNESIINLLIINLIISFSIVIFTQYLLNKILYYGFKEFIEDIFPTTVMTAILFYTVRLITFDNLFSDFYLLVTKILVGIFCYILLSYFTKNKNFIAIIEYLRIRVQKDGN